jgi:hypothetical protein
MGKLTFKLGRSGNSTCEPIRLKRSTQSAHILAAPNHFPTTSREPISGMGGGQSQPRVYGGNRGSCGGPLRDGLTSSPGRQLIVVMPHSFRAYLVIKNRGVAQLVPFDVGKSGPAGSEAPRRALLLQLSLALFGEFCPLHKMILQAYHAQFAIFPSGLIIVCRVVDSADGLPL